VSSELSEGCRDDLRKLARRWRQLVRNDPTAMLGPAGKALSPPELLLWLQAYGHAAPTVPAEGDSGTDPPTHPRTHTSTSFCTCMASSTRLPLIIRVAIARLMTLTDLRA
jgi:hypothetical protein